MRISDWSSDVCSSDLWWSPFLSRVLEPFAVVFNATPKIVVAPILIVWFGIGLLSKVMIAVLICAIVAWLGAFDGVRSADGDRKSVVEGKGVSVRVDPGGRRIIKKKKNEESQTN